MLYHSAKILRKYSGSPTVMILELEVPTLKTFSAGQWVDFVVPPHSWIGGFSIASSPKDLPKMTLAVKKSSHTPATWVHESSKVNQAVQVQVGGTSVLEAWSEDHHRRPHVFCAGGIGISPILSQYREFLSQRQSWMEQQSSSPSPPPPARFLYSASTQDELVFSDELLQLARLAKNQNPKDEMIFTLTQSDSWVPTNQEENDALVERSTGRHLKSFLDTALPDSIFYLCGPPQMLDEAENHLINKCGVATSQIRYEKWW